MTVTWRSTTPDEKLDYRCDLCGAPADTLHFVPGVCGTREVLFACPKHDAGGYWIHLKRWFDPKERFVEHVMKKQNSEAGLVLLADRIDELHRAEAKGGGTSLEIDNIAQFAAKPTGKERLH